MRPFRFSRVTELQELLDFKATHRSEGLLLAGGTDLIIEIRKQSPWLEAVEVADMTGVEALEGIDSPEAGGTVRLGALSTHAEVAGSALLARTAPLLTQAAAAVGSPQIRNRGTLGGNICNASPCADTVPALVALGADLTLRSIEGTRTVPLADFIEKPYQTVLRDDEVLQAIEFPPLPGAARSAFVKLGRRNALSISRMSVAVVLEEGPDGTLVNARIAAGSVAPTVQRFRSGEKVLLGETPSKERFEEAGREIAAEMIGISGRRWSTPFKEPVVASLVRRALFRAMGWGDGGER